MPPEEELPAAPQPEQQSPAETAPTAGRAAAIVTACVILALPLAYLGLHRAGSAQRVPSVAAQAAPSIVMLEAAVRESPTTANRINLSQAYIQDGQTVKAMDVLQTVIAAEPNNVIAWNNLCVAHTMQQDYKPALETCQRAVEINPSFQLARNNLKWATDENEKTLQALATMEQTPVNERDGKFYLNEGLDFLHTGDNDAAIKAWQRALVVDPKNALAANNIGDAYMVKKQPASALPWFQKAVAMDPSFQLAKNNMAWAKDVIAKAR